ncbi:MAG: hypothetical protein V7K77_14640 [Nostoc sp.]|uniref:hypothetical protein n=1 Tax=Nostoc sp. TaxID=1180 RepID=UPI002FF61540
MSEASSVITSMKSALDCASKCDCCANLQSQINAINAKLAGLKNIDENAIIQKSVARSEASIIPQIPGIAEGVATAIASGLIAPLRPKIQNAVDTASEAIGLAKSAESSASSAISRATVADLKAAQAVRDAEIATFRANVASGVATEAERRAVAAYDKAIGAESSAARAIGEAGKAVTEAQSATAKAVSATNTALEANSAVGGLKGIVEGLKGKVGALGEAIAKVETIAGQALVKAAAAVGISQQALEGIGRLAGRIAEIFQIIGTLATLVEQLATLNTLGGRIDAVEAGLERLGADVSGLLGRLLGLQNRIGRNEATIAEVRNIAIDAKGIGEAANLKAGQAIESVTGVRTIAVRADNKASQAQITADGAVRNASTANENANTAYKKATQAQSIGEQAKAIAGQALQKAGEAIGLGLTAIALIQAVRGLRGLKGDKGDPGIPGVPGRQGIPGRDGLNGITTVVTLPGTPGTQGIPGTPGRNGAPGRNGTNGINGQNGKDGRDVNPADLASLRGLIISQHAATRTSINTTSTGLVNGVKAFFTTQLAGITALITAIATNTYVEKALAVLTFAATIHNAFMLSNNLAQTLGMIIDQVLGFILPKGLDGNPISISNVLGKAAHEIIADTIGEANYHTITEDIAKANRIYQAGANVFNQIGNAVGLVTAGMEVIGGNVAKIGNALKIWGVIGEKAYSWMNPQPNLKGKFFNFINSATAEANTIAMMVAIPIGISAAALEINNSVGAIKKELDQEDPKDQNGNPITDKLGNPLKWEPGVTVPDPMKTVTAQEQAKADSKNIIEATLEDIFDGSD